MVSETEITEEGYGRTAVRTIGAGQIEADPEAAETVTVGLS